MMGEREPGGEGGGLLRAVTAFLAGIAAALLRFLRRILAQLKGGAVAMAPKGRKPTAAERMFIEGLFPGLKMNGWTVTGGATPAYNCFGYSFCSRGYGWRQPTPAAPAKKQLAQLDGAYMALGYALAMDCKPRKGFRKVAIYCDMAGAPTHAAKQIVGDWWESKLGANIRIVHRGTAALEGKTYGTVCRCYEIGLKAKLKLAQNQLKQIQAARMAGGNGNLKEAEQEAKEQISDLQKAIKTELP